MKLFFHYCLPSFNNCYILGTDDPESPNSGTAHQDAAHRDAAHLDAIIIDPGVMDEDILNFIEKNDYTLRGVLLTHDHYSHVRGLRTLKRIYDAEIYAVNPLILDQQATLIRDGDILTVGPFCVEVISVPGHSSDSTVFKIGNLLFTGDAINAGLVGTTASSYGAAIQMTALRSKILSLPGDCIILPGHGPPTSLDAERRFNAGIQLFEQRSKRRPSFTVNLF
ncbi:MAG: MBL fold metallo-hydrolase [Treponema sp.]|jgi:glyoxylase-like metal-dependent hydrolase (beta-lactamase superfamily II)|nr:MBL fold metallo-hydrolase [Treponema sp.]